MEDVASLQNQTQQAYDNASWQTGQDGGAGAYSWLGKVFGYDAAAANRQELLNSYYTNAFNSAEAAKNRNWQEYMSNTANQRAAKDLEAIGFSPMALLGGASSASTPAGYAASSSSSPSAHKGDGGALFGMLLKTIATLAISSAATNKAANSTNVDGNSSSTIAKNAAEGAAKGVAKTLTAGQQASLQKDWDFLLKELGHGPRFSPTTSYRKFTY